MPADGLESKKGEGLVALIQRIVTWDEVLQAADYLAIQIKPHLPEIDSLYTISRGGLPLVSCLTHRLSLVVPIRIIELRSYSDAFERDDDSKPVPQFLDRVSYKTPLVVDDIRDTGRTLELVRSSCNFERMMVVTMFAREGCKVSGVEILGTWSVVTRDVWVVFPWEVSTTS